MDEPSTAHVPSLYSYVFLFIYLFLFYFILFIYLYFFFDRVEIQWLQQAWDNEKLVMSKVVPASQR